jgi:leucyl aminopeptidase (aminopeptidase T)
MFNSWSPLSRELRNAARVAVDDVLKVREDERVVIVTNPERDVSRVSMALYDAVLDRRGRSVLLFQQRKSQLDFADPEVIRAISSEPQIVISVSAGKMGKDREGIKKPYEAEGKSYDSLFQYLLHGKRQLRSFWSPGVTEEMFSRTVPIDYRHLKRHCRYLKKVMDESAEIRITSAAGTDLRIGLQGRKAMVDDGDFSVAGSGGNLPAGEVFASPQLGSSSGLIVFDGCMSYYDGVALLDGTIEVEVVNGLITSISGGPEADRLKETLKRAEKKAHDLESQGKLGSGMGEAYAKNSYNLGEIGIGLNRQARLTGNMLEDEKVFGTCHIAIGSNYDEDAPTLIHLDGVIKAPSIISEFEGGTQTQLMNNGKHARFNGFDNDEIKLT